MMGGWFGRKDDARRLEALARDVEAMRTSLAAVVSQASVEAERAQEVARTVADLKDRLATLEGRVAAEALTLQAAGEVIAALGEGDQSDKADIVKLRVAVSRVERQLDNHVEQAGKAAAGLFERIESVRLGDGSALRPASREHPGLAPSR